MFRGCRTVRGHAVTSLLRTTAEKAHSSAFRLPGALVLGLLYSDSRGAG